MARLGAGGSCVSGAGESAATLLSDDLAFSENGALPRLEVLGTGDDRRDEVEGVLGRVSMWPRGFEVSAIVVRTSVLWSAADEDVSARDAFDIGKSGEGGMIGEALAFIVCEKPLALGRDVDGGMSAGGFWVG